MKRACLLTFLLVALVSCSNASPGEQTTATLSAPVVPPTPTLLTTEAIPVEGTVPASYLLSWPQPLPTPEQIAAVRDCELDKLQVERYPDHIPDEQLLDQNGLAARGWLTTPCDWAVLALAHSRRTPEGDAPPEAGIRTWGRAVSQNVAFAFAEPLFFAYFGLPGTVEPPPLSQTTLREASISYQWRGLDDEPLAYAITITNASTTPSARGEINGKAVSATVDVDLVQALGAALPDLLPVETMAPLIVCTDNYPDWHIMLTYEAGEQVELTTSGSTLYRIGGPWWVTLDNNLYLQTSAALIEALVPILEALALPTGRARTSDCGDWHYELVPLLYPDQFEQISYAAGACLTPGLSLLREARGSQ